MSDLLKKVLIGLIALYIISYVGASLFNVFYLSETELAIQKSSLYLEQAKKNQEAYLEAKYQQKENILNRQLEMERDMNAQLRSGYKQAGYKTNDQWQQERIRQEAYKKAQQEKRKKKYEADKIKQEQINEKNRIRRENERADREHIRKENLKTCKFWTQAYKEKPTIKNKNLRQTSCDRVYGR